MTSKQAEDEHLELLRRLFSEVEIECLWPPYHSPESSVEEEVVPEEIKEVVQDEEERPQPPQEEPVVEEEKPAPPVEIPKEVSAIFPSPSLRRIVPDRLRKIEALNRIHVLPESLKSDPASIPNIDKTPPKKYIDILADMTGCTKYKNNLAEFWFLDTLANLLRRAQADGMSKDVQSILIAWFCEWMKEMQHFDAASRERMLRRWKDNMLEAATFVADWDEVPRPKDVGISYKKETTEGDVVEETKKTEKVDAPARPKMSRSGTIGSKESRSKMASKMGMVYGYECKLRDLTRIIHYIYDLFSTDYQYNLVRSIFTFPPESHLIDTPYQIENPRRGYHMPKAKKEKPLKRKESQTNKKDSKDAKGKKAKGKTEGEPPEYLEMLEAKARHLKEQEDILEREREEAHKRLSILPLSFAATDEFFNEYWPPAEVEGAGDTKDLSPSQDKKKKGKGKKK